MPMPPSVPASRGRLFEGRTSALQLVIADDLPVVIETWERARQTRAACGDVHLAQMELEIEAKKQSRSKGHGHGL